ncbi:1-deoxy-D-xylulose-5-phosphate synthase N-terminal domain-containing protein, partial [Candidatus Ruminimicrobiellum ovillum]|uniref:1-deoxy-D-xylulose-5-phosphate synthase N-terminal domain-containing protein n=1 Tax=Candidatus Ruminimicrobiellum ovillum TaxID=1947927 RepID=UPI00355A8BF0
MSIMDNISSPNAIKIVKKDLLPDLAQEVRQEIIETVSKTGGHLASSLGVVELTIALHRVFDSPKDAIIWDV